jgi:outer membrane lipoprotein SlyB
VTGPATLRDVCLDANDPAVVGAFWGAVLGREPA